MAISLIWMIIIMVAVSYGVSMLTKKPNPKFPGNDLDPAEDIDVPTAKEGKSVPVLFGTRRMKGANVVWYGHIKTTEIKK